MSIENVEAAPIEQAPNGGTEIPGEVAPQADVESRAKAMGWVPKDQFRGDESKWRDADDFVKRGEEELPILRERSRDLARKTAELEAKFEKREREFESRMQQYGQMTAAALRQQRERIVGDYEAAKRSAVEIGDVTRYEQLQRDQREAVHQFDEQLHTAAKPAQQPQNVPIDVQAKIISWQAQNPWYVSDPSLNQYEQIVHIDLNSKQPNMSLEDNLAEVAKRVRATFPEKFQSAGRPAAVESGNGLATGGKRSRGFSDMPSDDQRVADEFIKAGAYKTRADFAKAYWAMNGG